MSSLKQAVNDGRVRWVLVDSSSSGMPNDGRTGSQSIMTWAAQAGHKMLTSNGATLYDLKGSV